MKIVILGATGRTGQHLVTQALDRGYNVLALVRNPSKFKLIHENLQVIQTDIFAKDELQMHIQGYDVIMSCLGAPKGFSRVTLYSDYIKPLVHAMRDSNITRLVVLTSWYSRETREESFVFKYLVRKLLIGRLLDDMDRMEEYIRENCQDLNYTVIRPPILTDDDKIVDKEIIAKDGYLIKHGSSMPRANVASYMLDTIGGSSQLHVKQMVAITFRTLQTEN